MAIDYLTVKQASGWDHFVLVFLSQSFHRRLWKTVYKYGGELVKESATPNLPFNTKIAYLRIFRESDY